MKNIFKAVVVLIICLSFVAPVFANDCFISSGKAFRDAQTIRKIAKSMGWTVKKSASVAAGEGMLVFKAQSSSSDSGDAVWRNLHASRQ